MRVFSMFIAGIFALTIMTGCATTTKTDRSQELQQQVIDLKRQLEELQAGKGSELSELQRAKLELEKQLHAELSEYKAKLEMTEDGLKVTFLAEVFFDSGKDVIKSETKQALAKVAEVLNTEVSEYLVAVAGHTDNEPIRHSGWKSNWELSSGRALAVLHYFVDEGQMSPERLSATAYGEYKPVADNNTPEGRGNNRRVEIVIFPREAKPIIKQSLR